MKNKITIEFSNDRISFINGNNSKVSAGVERIILAKNELEVKYDRLLKDYELARHEVKQKTEHIGKLEKEQEELLKENIALREVIAEQNERINTYAKRTALFIETIDGIRNLINRE